MTTFFAVFRRELAEQRLLFLAGALLGVVCFVLPWAVPLLPGATPQPVAELRLAATMGVGTGALLLLVLLLGSGILARPLADGRLAFFLHRPIPIATLVLAKLGAAFATLLGVVGLIALPTLLVQRPALAAGEPTLALVAVLGLLLALMMVHSLAVSLLSRGPMLAVEITAFLIAALAIGQAYQALQANWAPDTSNMLAAGAVASAAVLGTIAALVALARGRADQRAVHRWQASLAAGAVLLVAGGATAYASWYLSPPPDDLMAVNFAVPSPDERWLALGGPARHRSEGEPRYLLGPAGRVVELGMGAHWYGVTYSPDSRYAAWQHFQGPDNRGLAELVVVDLTASAREVMRLPLSMRPGLLSFTGNSNALITGDANDLLRVEIAGNATPRRLLRLPEGRQPEWIINTPDGNVELVVWFTDRNTWGQWSAWLIDPEDGTVLRRSAPLSADPFSVTFDPNHRFLSTAKSDQTTIVDLATGETRFTLPWKTGLADVAFEPDGSVLVLHEQKLPRFSSREALNRAPAALLHLDSRGTELARHPLSPGRAQIAGRTARGVTLARPNGPAAHLEHLDLTTGEITAVGPIGLTRVWTGQDLRPFLYLDANGTLLAPDGAPGTLRTVWSGLPPPAAKLSKLAPDQP